MSRVLKLALILVALLALQQRLFNAWSFAGLRPVVLLLVPIAAAIDGDAVRAASVGFATGLALDLFLETPFGAGALAFALVGYGVAAVERGVIRADVWLQPAVAGAASAAGVVLFAAVVAVFGQSQYLRPEVFATAAFAGALNVPLSLVVTRAVRWALGPVGIGLPERTYA